MFPVSDVVPPKTTPFVTIAVIVANLVVFAYQLRLDGVELIAFLHTFGSVPAEFQWTRAITGAFVHEGWIHVAGNVVYLWIFGGTVENAMGRRLYLLYYVAAASVGAVAHAILHPASTLPLIGASGAVAAVLGTYFALYPRSQVLTVVFLVLSLEVVEIPAVYFLAAWVLLQMASGLTATGPSAAGGLAFAAHAAGFAAGAAIGLLLRRRAHSWD